MIGLNGTAFQFYHQYQQLIKGYEDSIVTISVLRGADTVDVRARVNDKGKLGFFAVSPLTMFGTVTKEFTFMEAIPVGFNRCWETLDRYITGIKQIFTGKVDASDSLGSVISIGNTFPGVWDWERFWTLTGIFYFFIASMASMLPDPWKKRVTNMGVGTFYYYCPAYNNLLLLENLIWQKRRRK